MPHKNKISNIKISKIKHVETVLLYQNFTLRLNVSVCKKQYFLIFVIIIEL